MSFVNTLGASDSENLAKVQSLGAVAPDDSSIGSECISFAVNSEGRDIVRIILPDHSMKTIFGGVTGNQRINLSAIANSDGSSCTALAHPSTCGPPPPVSTPGSTAPPPDYPSWCADIGHNVWFFAYEWTYDHCQAYFHNTRDLTD